MIGGLNINESHNLYKNSQLSKLVHPSESILAAFCASVGWIKYMMFWEVKRVSDALSRSDRNDFP